MDVQRFYYGLAACGIMAGGLWAVAKAALWVVAKFASIETKLELIMSNHLEHIYEELQYLRKRIDD